MPSALPHPGLCSQLLSLGLAGTSSPALGRFHMCLFNLQDLGGKEGNHGWAQCVSARLYPHLALEPSDVNLTNLCASVLSAASYQTLKP